MSSHSSADSIGVSTEDGANERAAKLMMENEMKMKRPTDHFFLSFFFVCLSARSCAQDGKRGTGGCRVGGRAAEKGDGSKPCHWHAPSARWQRLGCSALH